MRTQNTICLLPLLAIGITGCTAGGIFGGSSGSYPTISIAPIVVSVGTGKTAQFTPTVNNLKNPRLRWSVIEGSAGGTISSTGLYTAPKTIGTFHVVVSAQSYPIATATAT